MLYRAHLQLFLLILVAAATVAAQSTVSKTPLTKTEVFAALEASSESEELLKKANLDLIAAIAERGVDFVLTPEEEWQLSMRDGSEELLDAIRNAIDPAERELKIKIDLQERLYTTFATNFNANDYSGKSAALYAAREFIGQFADDPNVKEIVNFMQRNLPRLEQSVNMLQQREEAMERARAQAAERQQRLDEMRLERERRQQEAAARAEERRNNNSGAASNQRETQNSKDAPQFPRQPTDPVVRAPRIPVTRRP
jgi:hypothetical protein